VEIFLFSKRTRLVSFTWRASRSRNDAII